MVVRIIDRSRFGLQALAQGHGPEAGPPRVGCRSGGDLEVYFYNLLNKSLLLYYMFKPTITLYCLLNTPRHFYNLLPRGLNPRHFYNLRPWPRVGNTAGSMARTPPRYYTLYYTRLYYSILWYIVVYYIYGILC